MEWTSTVGDLSDFLIGRLGGKGGPSLNIFLCESLETSDGTEMVRTSFKWTFRFCS